MDLYGKDRGNVSLPPRLRPPDYDDEKLEDVIFNTQQYFYELKIAEINKRVQRLQERNAKLENSLGDVDNSIKALEQEKMEEISGLNSQINSQVDRIEESKKQLAVLEKSRIEDESIHAAKVMKINKKYKNTRLKLTSQIKLLSAKTNILEDYKSVQHILENKLDTQNQDLVREKEQIAESLCQIERKFKIDREKLKKELYNRLLDLAGVFQLAAARQIPRPISKLLSENIAVNNTLATITKDAIIRKHDYIQRKNAVNEYEKKINNARLNTKRFVITAKLQESIKAMLQEACKNTNATLTKSDKSRHLTEQQYICNKDKAIYNVQKCEAHIKHLEVLLYREKEKLTVAKDKKQWISDQLELYFQMFHDAQCALTNLKTLLCKQSNPITKVNSTEIQYNRN